MTSESRKNKLDFTNFLWKGAKEFNFRQNSHENEKVSSTNQTYFGISNKKKKQTNKQISSGKNHRLHPWLWQPTLLLPIGRLAFFIFVEIFVLLF